MRFRTLETIFDLTVRFIVLVAGAEVLYRMEGRSKHVQGASLWKVQITSYAEMFQVIEQLHTGSTGTEHNAEKYMLRTFQLTHVVFGLRGLLREYVKVCDGCQERGNKVGNSRRVVCKPIKTTRPLEHMQMDAANHPEDIHTGSRYTCALKCLFTGYIWVEVFASKDPEAIALWVLRVFDEEGVQPPDGFVSADEKGKERLLVHTDNGGEFVNTTLAKVVELYGARHVRGKPWQPWVQGGVERIQASIKKHLSNSVPEYRNNVRCAWASAVPSVTRRVNAQPNDERRDGMSPFFCLRGRHPHMWTDANAEADAGGEDFFEKQAKIHREIQVRINTSQ